MVEESSSRIANCFSKVVPKKVLFKSLETKKLPNFFIISDVAISIVITGYSVHFIGFIKFKIYTEIENFPQICNFRSFENVDQFVELENFENSITLENRNDFLIFETFCNC